MKLSALIPLACLISTGLSLAAPDEVSHPPPQSNSHDQPLTLSQASKSRPKPASGRIVCAADIPTNNPRCARGYECIRNDEATDLICTLQFPNPNCLNGFCVKKFPNQPCGGFPGPSIPANVCPRKDQICFNPEPQCPDCPGFCVKPQKKKTKGGPKGRPKSLDEVIGDGGDDGGSSE